MISLSNYQTWGRKWQDSLTGIAKAWDFTHMLWTTSSMTRSLAASQRLHAAASLEQLKAPTGTPSRQKWICHGPTMANASNHSSVTVPDTYSRLMMADVQRVTETLSPLSRSVSWVRHPQNQGTILTRSTNSSDVPFASNARAKEVSLAQVGVPMIGFKMVEETTTSITFNYQEKACSITCKLNAVMGMNKLANDTFIRRDWIEFTS